MNIPEHRKAIDKLDAHIVRLLNERTRHVLAIGGIKLKAGEEIYAPHRERAVFQRVCRLNAGPITNDQFRAIYREIMSSALALEKTMTIAYLGPEATFTHQAAIQKFGASLRYAPQKTIADVFTEVGKNRADYGVVPVENSTEGVVTHTLDMFVDSELKIVSQIVLPMQHCLMTANGPRAKIRHLYVHPQSLGAVPHAGCKKTCRAWKSSRPRPTRVRRNWPRTDKNSAAIAGIIAAGKIRAGRPGAGHPGQRRERDALSGSGPPVQPAHRRRPDEPDGERGGQSRRAASRDCGVPPVQNQHDENRIAPQQAEGVGIFLLH